MNSTMASAISDSVLKLLNHTTDLVRKKAILVLQKMVNKLLLSNKLQETPSLTTRIK